MDFTLNNAALYHCRVGAPYPGTEALGQQVKVVTRSLTCFVFFFTCILFTVGFFPMANKLHFCVFCIVDIPCSGIETGA